MSRDAEGRSVIDVTLADSVAEFSKYSGWPELKESFMAGKLRAAYLLAPMVMDLVDSGVPAKIVGEAGCAEPSRTMDQMINAIGL